MLRKARGRLDGQVHGAAPAPYKALDLIEGALSGWSLEEGYAAEEEAVGELLPGRQAQASLYAFDLVDRRARSAPGKPSIEPRPLRKVGLVGAGLMAAQLATLFLRRLEVPVAMRDLSEEALGQARSTIEEGLAEQVAKGRYDEGKARFLASLVSTSTGYDDFADCDLVLEAVFEELEVKQQVFAELREHTRPDCVLATNTSSLSVTRWAPTSASTSSTRSRYCRWSSSSARRTPTTRRSPPPGPSPRGCASGRCSSPTRRRSSSTACSRA